jgi:hypothetical protein
MSESQSVSRSRLELAAVWDPESMDGTQWSVLGLWTIVVCLWIMRLALSFALAIWAAPAGAEWPRNVSPRGARPYFNSYTEDQTPF